MIHDAQFPSSSWICQCPRGCSSVAKICITYTISALTTLQSIVVGVLDFGFVVFCGWLNIFYIHTWYSMYVIYVYIYLYVVACTHTQILFLDQMLYILIGPRAMKEGHPPRTMLNRPEVYVAALATSASVFKIKIKHFMYTLILKIFLQIMKINNFRGDLTDISALNETLFANLLLGGWIRPRYLLIYS